MKPQLVCSAASEPRLLCGSSECLHIDFIVFFVIIEDRLFQVKLVFQVIWHSDFKQSACKCYWADDRAAGGSCVICGSLLRVSFSHKFISDSVSALVSRSAPQQCLNVWRRCAPSTDSLTVCRVCSSELWWFQQRTEVSCLWMRLINWRMSPESLQTWNLWKYGDNQS